MNKSKMIICPDCGAEAQEEDNFCGKCGSKIGIKKSSGNKNSQNSVSGKMIYIISGLFVLLIVVIVFLNQKSTGNPEASQQNIQQPAMEVMPPIDAEKIKELKNRVAKSPKDTDGLLSLANTLHDAGILDEAITYYKKYLELNKKDPDARVDLGICYTETGDNKSAISEMEQAVEYAPKHQKAHFNLGIINLKESNLQEANKYFKKCYEIDPATPTGMQAKEILDQHQNLKSKNK
jgi:tetratricopeptide (TPR) repeat protein